MKKTMIPVCLLLLLCVMFAAAGASPAELHPGDTVVFGNYPQRGEAAEPIEWTVLEVQDGRAMLISRYLLDMKTYYHTTENVTWETSSLRQWLNDEFLHTAFTAEEASAIMLTEVDNSDGQGNSEWDRSHGGKNTQDYLFLLSYREAFEQYYQEDGDRVCEATNYAVSRGAYTRGDRGAGWWWLRSPGYYQSRVEITGSDGTARSIENNRVAGCVRPVFWVDTESGVFAAEQEAAQGEGEPAGSTFTDDDLSGTWFGFEPSGEADAGFWDYRLLRFNPESNRLDIIRSCGYYPETYTGTYRISGDTLLYTIESEYSDGYEETIPITLINGELVMNWFGRCAMTRADNGCFPDDPEKSLFMGEDRQYYFSPAEDGTIVIDGCTAKDETVEVPATIFGRPVTEIGSTAFGSRDELKRVVLPEGIRTIGNSAFNYDYALESISLPGTLVSIKYSAFEHCSSLKEIVIPEGTEFIGSDAFDDCSALKLVMLPSSLKEIEDNPFWNINTDDIVFLVVQGSYAESWCQEQGIRYRALDDSELTKDTEAYKEAAVENAPRDRHLSEFMDGDEPGSLPGLLYTGANALEAGADPQTIIEEMRAAAEKGGMLNEYLYACENIAAEGTENYERLLSLEEKGYRYLSVNYVYGKEIDYDQNLSVYESIPVPEKLKEALADSTAEFCFSPFYWKEQDFSEIYGKSFERFTPAKPRPGYGCVVLRDVSRGEYIPAREDLEDALRYAMEEFLNRFSWNSNGILTGNPQLASYFWVFDFSWPFHGVYGTDFSVKGYDCAFRLSLVDAKDHHTIAEFSYTNELGNTIYEWHDGIALADIPSTYSLDEEKLDAFAKKVNEYIDSLIR